MLALLVRTRDALDLAQPISSAVAHHGQKMMQKRPDFNGLRLSRRKGARFGTSPRLKISGMVRPTP
jgi:hypothetical protein